MVFGCQRFCVFIYWRLIVAGKDITPPTATDKRGMANLPWEQLRFFVIEKEDLHIK